MTCSRPGCHGSLWLDRVEKELVCLLCARRTPLRAKGDLIAEMVAVYKSDPLEVACRKA